MSYTFLNITDLNSQPGTGALNRLIVQWANDLIAGNTAVICVFSRGGNDLTGITDSVGNTYSNSGAFAVMGGTDGELSLWYKTNILGGTTPTVTIQFLDPQLDTDVFLLQYSGGAIASPLDVISVAEMNTGTVITSGSLTPTVTDGLAISFTRVASSTIAGFSGVIAGVAGTSRFFNAVSSPAVGCFVQDRIFTSSIGSAITASATYGASFDRAGTIFAILKAEAVTTIGKTGSDTLSLTLSSEIATPTVIGEVKTASDAALLTLSSEVANTNVGRVANDALSLTLSLESASLAISGDVGKTASDSLLLLLSSEVANLGISESKAASDPLLLTLSSEVANTTISGGDVKVATDTLLVSLASEAANTNITNTANDTLLLLLSSEVATQSISGGIGKVASDAVLVTLSAEIANRSIIGEAKVANDALLLSLSSEIATPIIGGAVDVKVASDTLLLTLSTEFSDRRNLTGVDQVKVGSDTLSLLLTDTLIDFKRPISASEILGLLLSVENSTRTITEGGGEPEVAFFVDTDAIMTRMIASDAVLIGEIE